MRFIDKKITSLAIGAFLFVFPASAMAEAIEVTANPIPLQNDTPEHITVGKLSYAGGLHLVTGDGRFGGFSGLGVSQDGERLVSVSDRGVSLSMRMTYDAKGNLIGGQDFDLGTLADRDGTSLKGKRWTDAEAMSPGVDGEIIIAFERDHRIWRYDAGATKPRVLRPPEEVQSMPGNDGIEALTLLNDGRMLAISEGSPREDFTVGWVSRVGGWDVLTYKTGDGFRATGAATLPDGDVLVLERFYTPRQSVRIRIKRVDHSTIEAGGEVRGALIAELSPPTNVDNFEGIDVRPGPDGTPYVYLISDDNFSDDQRTLLMMFKLNNG